jgi:hypothetical protein
MPPGCGRYQGVELSINAALAWTDTVDGYDTEKIAHCNPTK